MQSYNLTLGANTIVPDILQVHLEQLYGSNPIFYYRKGTQMSISGSIAARGLKFWLQVALSALFATPWTEIRKSGSRSGKSGFSGKIFFASTDLLGPQGHLPDGPESPNPDPDWQIRFFENPNFSFFHLFKLKDPTIWVSMDSSGPN